MWTNKFILGLFFTFSLFALPAEKPTTQLQTDTITSNLKSLVMYCNSNPYVKNLTYICKKFPLAVSALFFSLQDVYCNKENARMSAVAANVMSIYGAPIIMKYFQEVGLINKDHFFSSPTDAVTKYYLLNYLIVKVLKNIIKNPYFKGKVLNYSGCIAIIAAILYEFNKYKNIGRDSQRALNGFIAATGLENISPEQCRYIDENI